MIISIFLKTPSITLTNLDASYLFNVVYPIVFIMTSAVFIMGGYVACYFTSYKIAYKARVAQPKRKAKMQIIICGIFILIWNLFFGIDNHFIGLFGIQFWYPAALTGRIFGLFDVSNMLAYVSPFDVATNSFVITGLFDTIGFIIFFYSLVLTTAFTWASYRGRISGEINGIKAINKYVEDLKNSSPSNR
jgi:hypothetical protein